MSQVTQSPVFGLLISILAFRIGVWVKDKTQSDFANPLLVAMVLIIGFLKAFDIPYAHYQRGASGIHFVLGPLTVALGMMLYRQRLLIKKHLLALTLGILSGIFTSFFSILLLSRLIGVDNHLITSMLPKSITMPMALSLSQMLDATPAITVVMVVLTGVSGALLAPFMVKFFPFLNPIAVGIGIGTASHAVGTGKAIEIGEKEGALSSAAIGITGIITVIVVPFLYPLISLF